MHMQLIVLMALAEGVSRIRTGPLTLHTKTAIHVAEKMTDGKVISLMYTERKNWKRKFRVLS